VLKKQSGDCGMPVSAPRIYWDACVFLSHLNGEEGRADVIEQIMDEASDGKWEILTSTVSQVEVAFGKAEQDQKAPDPEVLAAIEAYWLPESPVKLIEFHRLIALDARDLVRVSRIDQDKRLTPIDAVHLASAQRLGAIDFHTYDGHLLDRNGEFEFPIREPWSPEPRITGWSESAGA
jgi:predicted nucleic acid-binding protein